VASLREQAMRKLVVSLALALAAAYSVEAGYRVVQLGEVIALARQGVSDRTIVSFLENRELDFVVGTDEILRLREAGVGEPVIRYLIKRTAPRDPYSSGPYADGARYPDYGNDDYGSYAGSPYDDPGYGGAYIEYGPRYGTSYYLGAALGPYVAYDGYYRGGLVGWLGRTFGFGHHYGRYYSNRYDHGRSYRYYDRGRSYRYDYGRSYRYDRNYRSDRGRTYAPSYSYSYRGNPGRSYRTSYGRSSGYRDHGSRYTGDKAVPRGGGHSGGRGRR